MPFTPLHFLKGRYIGHPFRLASAMIKTCFVFHLIQEFGYTAVPTMGASMLPTFEVIGDSVLISKSYRRGKGIKVGDVVQFDPVHEPGAGVIKRVLGLEGDYVLRNSPGSRFDDMIQVWNIKIKITPSALEERERENAWTNAIRCLKVTVGLSGTIWTIQEIQDILAQCQWRLSEAK